MSERRRLCARVVPLGGGRALLRAFHGDATRIVSLSFAEAVARGAGTLDEHAARSGLPRDETMALLADLSAGGFLLSDREIGERASGAPAGALELSAVAMPTRNRVAGMLDSLRSYADNAVAHGRKPAIVVVDNSTDASTQAACRAGLAALARGSGLEVSHAGTPERERYIDALVARGLAPDVVRFALSDVEGQGFAVGANRNLIALQLAGEAYLSVDDDTRCRPTPCPETASGVDFYSHDGDGYDRYNPQDYWFFDTRSDALAAAPAHDADVLSLHARLLGRRFSDLLATEDGARFDDADPRLLERALRGRGRVLVTFCGLIGDVGWYAPTWYLLLEGASRERLVASEDSYLRACLRSREVLRVVRRATVTDGRFCQAAVMGIDARGFVPPFMPIARYEDGVFRMTVRWSMDDAYFAHLPWALLHDPPEPRAFERDDVWRTSGWTRMGELMVQCIASAALGPSRDAEERSRALGRHLIELGRLSEADFEEVARLRFWRQKGMYCAHLASLVERYGGPSYWADDVRRHIDAFHDACMNPAFFVPRDLAAATMEDARRLRQRIVRRFGELLVAWPDILAAARELKDQGVRPATPA